MPVEIATKNDPHDYSDLLSIWLKDASFPQALGDATRIHRKAVQEHYIDACRRLATFLVRQAYCPHYSCSENRLSVRFAMELIQWVAAGESMKELEENEL